VIIGGATLEAFVTTYGSAATAVEGLTAARIRDALVARFLCRLRDAQLIAAAGQTILGGPTAVALRRPAARGAEPQRRKKRAQPSASHRTRVAGSLWVAKRQRWSPRCASRAGSARAATPGALCRHAVLFFDSGRSRADSVARIRASGFVAVGAPRLSGGGGLLGGDDAWRCDRPCSRRSSSRRSLRLVAAHFGSRRSVRLRQALC